MLIFTKPKQVLIARYSVLFIPSSILNGCINEQLLIIYLVNIVLKEFSSYVSIIKTAFVNKSSACTKIQTCFPVHDVIQGFFKAIT